MIVDSKEIKEPSDTIINIVIDSKNQQDETIIINNFIKTIYDSNKRNTTKTKIHILQLEEEITTKSIPNPKYTEWLQKKELLSKLKPEDCKDELIEFLKCPSPLEEIVTEIRKKKIALNKLNEIEKSFDALYLRKQDKDNLMSSLDMFKNQGHVLKEMGFQNKFNLLLHGLPGTGKSTTILAVANYLQKDIYYVDLQRLNAMMTYN